MLYEVRPKVGRVVAWVILGPVVLILLGWIWLLSSNNVLNHPLVEVAPWPVACSLKRCITTAAWRDHHQARQAFAATSEQTEPSEEESLTTLLRQHLVAHAFIAHPVTLRDATRYREEILKAGDGSQVVSTTNLTLEEYDETVILPLLQQEALKSERSAETLDELYTILADERLIMAWPWHLKWDKSQAAVIRR